MTIRLPAATTLLLLSLGCGGGDKAPAGQGSTGGTAATGGAAAGGAAAGGAAGAALTGAGATFPQSDLHQVVRRVRQGDGRPHQLPVDRIRRRDPAVHRGHRGLRRHRWADDG